MHTPESLGDPEAVNTLGRVRTGDRDTSQAAAERLTNGILRDSQEEVYYLLAAHPSTDDELRQAVASRHGGQVSKSGPATRRGELERAGWVRPLLDDVGRVVKRPSDNAQPMTVWQAVPLAEHTGPTETVAQRRKREQADDRHEAGIRAARDRASWDIGDPEWAEVIIRAYLHPEADQAALAEEMDA